MKNMFNVTTVLPHNLLQTNPCIRRNFSTQAFRKRAAQLHYVAQLRAHSEVVPRAFWRLVSKSCDECKGSFARGCEAKRWSHWTCSSLGTIFQPVMINSVLLIIKMCYVHNQWYDISCSTLYVLGGIVFTTCKAQLHVSATNVGHLQVVQWKLHL